MREACTDLVTRHAWTCDQALELTMPDHVATRIIELKNATNVNVAEETKFQTAFTIFIRQESNVDKPSRSQLLCMNKMKRFYLKDNNQLEPQKFFNLIVTMNDMFPWIDPVVTVNNKLTNDHVFLAFTQPISPKWALEAKSNGFIDDRIRFFNFLRTKHVVLNNWKKIVMIK